MGSYFSESVAWWEESQLRFLVLCSLFLQYFLFIAAPLRKFNVPSWFRFLTWLAYIGGDAIAIYAYDKNFLKNSLYDKFWKCRFYMRIYVIPHP